MRNLILFFASVFVFILVSAMTLPQTKEDGELVQVKHIDFQKTKLPKELKPILGELVYVPGGTFTSALIIDTTFIVVPRRVTVSSFYLGRAEVTNAQYKLFCKEMIALVGKDSASKLLPDTTTFIRNAGSWTEAYVNYYYSHLAYSEYPVIGVTWHQAHAYCEWLTKKLQELYKSHPEWGDKYPIAGIHLPTEMEWEYAALGNYLRNAESCPYSWGYDLTEVKKEKITYKGNFGKIIDKDGVVIKDVSVADNLSNDINPTAKAISFTPNDYGIYHLSGNVNEWVMDVFRPTDKSKDDLNFSRDSIRYRRNPDLELNIPLVNDRVIKGGGFLDGPAYCLISNRRPMAADSARCDVGFRISMICVGSPGK